MRELLISLKAPLALVRLALWEQTSGRCPRLHRQAALFSGGWGTLPCEPDGLPKCSSLTGHFLLLLQREWGSLEAPLSRVVSWGVVGGDFRPVQGILWLSEGQQRSFVLHVTEAAEKSEIQYNFILHLSLAPNWYCTCRSAELMLKVFHCSMLSTEAWGFSLFLLPLPGTRSLFPPPWMQNLEYYQYVWKTGLTWKQTGGFSCNPEFHRDIFGKFKYSAQL